MGLLALRLKAEAIIGLRTVGARLLSGHIAQLGAFRQVAREDYTISWCRMRACDLAYFLVTGVSEGE